MNRVRLSRRNLELLLEKLDDPNSHKTIIKRDDQHPKYPSTQTIIIAVEDEDYYYERAPGAMANDDSPQENS